MNIIIIEKKKPNKKAIAVNLEEEFLIKIVDEAFSKIGL